MRLGELKGFPEPKVFDIHMYDHKHGYEICKEEISDLEIMADKDVLIEKISHAIFYGPYETLIHEADRQDVEKLAVILLNDLSFLSLKGKE